MGAETWAFFKEFRQSEITLAATKGRAASWISIFSDSVFVAKTPLREESCRFVPPSTTVHLG